MAVTYQTTDTAPRLNGRSRLIDLAGNALLLSVLWLAYSTVRGVTAGAYTTAANNAESILRLQQSLGLPNEATIQAAVLGQTWLLKGANLYYIGVHFPITIIFLTWIWRNHHEKFARVRNALIATTAAALAIHVVYPLKPPRMMRGFVDTARVFGPDPYQLSISSGANQLAAMPSLHFGWALLIALGAIWAGRSSRRWLMLVHPVVTLAVVVLTANHYWIDAIAAAAIVAVAWLLTRPTRRRRAERSRSAHHAESREAACEPSLGAFGQSV